jgi:hypothetical protein
MMADPQRIEKLRPDHATAGFDCGQEELNRFLSRFALVNVCASAAQTYVALSGETVVGYYPLAVGTVASLDKSPLRRPKKGGQIAQSFRPVCDRGDALPSSCCACPISPPVWCLEVNTLLADRSRDDLHRAGTVIPPSPDLDWVHPSTSGRKQGGVPAEEAFFGQEIGVMRNGLA